MNRAASVAPRHDEIALLSRVYSESVLTAVLLTTMSARCSFGASKKTPAVASVVPRGGDPGGELSGGDPTAVRAYTRILIESGAGAQAFGDPTGFGGW